MQNKVLIADLRKSKGWTQELLAEKTNLSVRTIQRLEAGNVASLETLRIVAEALDVSVAALFEKIESESVQREIENYNATYTLQINQRQTIESLFNVFSVMFYVLMTVLLVLFAYFHHYSVNHPFFYLSWLGVILISFPLHRYLKLTQGNQLNKQFPLTASLLTKARSQEKRFPIWWDEKPTRYVITIFWSTIIPLLFIIKFVLHII